MTDIPASVVKGMVCHLQHREHSPGERWDASRTTMWLTFYIILYMDLGICFFFFLRRKDSQQKYLLLMKRLFSLHYSRIFAISKFKFNCKKCKLYNPLPFLSSFLLFGSFVFLSILSHFGIVSCINCVFFI